MKINILLRIGCLKAVCYTNREMRVVCLIVKVRELSLMICFIDIVPNDQNADLFSDAPLPVTLLTIIPK